MLALKAINTKAAKITIDEIFIGLIILAVNFGNLFEMKIPIAKGIPNNRTTVLIISKGLMLISFNKGAVAGFKLAQIVKFKGVVINAIKVENAVRLTANATFAFANEEIKLEIFPPGQAATKIIPNAMLGEGFKIKVKTKVKAGVMMT